MTVIAYPGPAVRAVPAFTCTCPAGWTAAEAAGALVVVRPPTGAPGATGVGGELVAEVRIETVRVPATARLADIAAANLARRRRLAPDLVLVTQKTGRFDRVPAHLCGAAWTADSGERVAQLQVVLLAPQMSPDDHGREVADAFVITGVCAESDAPTLVPEYVRLASSIRFGTDAAIRPSAAVTAAPESSAATRANPLDADPFTTAAS
ncbi:MAG: hypothetical protein KDB40_14930 [Acidimicrobiales bacterium]|nr:hypothetical protein [Acidimicrobiales bacterium]